MSYTIIGTCGACGGPVESPVYPDADPIPAKIMCIHCGATPARKYGPVIPMYQESEAVEEKDDQ